MLSDAVRRHGIGGQVEAAMVVKCANDELDSLVEQTQRKDLRAISYVRGELLVVCRHNAAAHLATSLRSSLVERIEVEVPRVTIRNIICRIDTHSLDSRSEIT